MPKRILEGVVVSDKGEKTVVVKVERTLLHPLLKKTVRSSKKYHAHDEANALKVGDVVWILGNPGRNPADHRIRMLTLKRAADGFSWGDKAGETVD